MNRKTSSALVLVAAMAGSAVASSSAQSQQYSEPWRFSPQNRAQLAVTMKQLKDAKNQNATLSASPGTASLTTIVCGGGSATATANNTCIILNNATGAITTDQDALGDQQASNSTETNTVNSGSDADEVLKALSGN